MSDKSPATTAYFRNRVLPDRPYVTVALCRSVLDAPLRKEQQTDGRWRTWGLVSLPDGTGTRILRVITLPDGTLQNAFLDRGFREER